MMKEEFERLAGVKVAPEDYKEIDFVYTWHPGISETAGKMQIATLWTIGGRRLIMDMKPTATKAMELSREITDAKSELVRLEHRMKLLKEGRV